MWKTLGKALAFSMLLSVSKFSYAGLISDISTETVSEYLSVGGFGWNSSYDIGLVNQDLVIDVDVFLDGFTPSTSLVNDWEFGIESIWNNTFDIFDGTYLYDVVFNVDWVGSLAEADHRVIVHEGNGNVNLVDWYTGNPSGWGYSNQGRVAAHEFGHMIGLFDEYPGGATIPGTVRYDSIMGGGLSTVQADHFDGFVDWLTIKTGMNGISVQASVGDNHYDFSQPIPTPAILILFLTAIGFMQVQRRR